MDGVAKEVSPGYYSTGGTRTTRTGQSKCGGNNFYCVDGIRKRVPIFGQEAWAKSCADGSALPDLWQQIAKDNEVPLWNLPPVDHYRDAIAGGKLDVLKLPATKNAGKVTGLAGECTQPRDCR